MRRSKEKGDELGSVKMRSDTLKHLTPSTKKLRHNNVSKVTLTVEVRKE